MIFKRKNLEIEVIDRVEAAICLAAGWTIVDAGELNDRTLDDIDDRELRGIAVSRLLTSLATEPAANIRETVAPYMIKLDELILADESEE